MKEFIEKLIGRLEEKIDEKFIEAADKRNVFSDYPYKVQAFKEAIEIVNQLAEEYKPCNKLSCEDCEVYDKEKHYCTKWCEVIKHTTSELAEEHKNNVMINGQYCWQTCGATEHCKECNRLCNGSIDYYENYDVLAEEYNNGWISVDDSLPELTEGTECFKQSPCCLVTLKWWDGDMTESIGWYNQSGVWNDDCESCKVIAWMPLPPKYQPKGE